MSKKSITKKERKARILKHVNEKVDALVEQFPELAEDAEETRPHLVTWDPAVVDKEHPFVKLRLKANQLAVKSGAILDARGRRRVIMADLDKLHRIFSEQLEGHDLSEYLQRARESVATSPCLECGVNASAKLYMDEALELACAKGMPIDLWKVHQKVGFRYALHVRLLAESKDLVEQDDDDDEFFENYLTTDEYAARQKACAECEFLVGTRCRKFCSCSGDLHESRRRDVKCPEKKW